MRVQRLSLSEGTFGFVFAASSASYWLATEPHPMRTCEAAPAPFESTVLYSGWRRTSSPVIDSFAANDHDRPVILEVFTDKENDVKVLKGYRRAIAQDLPAAKLARQIESIPVVHQIAQTEQGKAVKETLKKGLKKIFNS